MGNSRTITVMEDGNPVLIDLDQYISEAVRDAVKALVPKGTKVVPSARLDGTPFGINASYHIDGDKLVIVADLGSKAASSAKLTNNKRNWLIASSKGNPEIKGSPIPGLRIALNLWTEDDPRKLDGNLTE